MKRVIFVFANGLFAVLFSFGSTVDIPPLKWESSSADVEIKDGFATFDTRKGAVAQAVVDLRPYENAAVLVSVRGEVRNVSSPPRHWNGVKVMLLPELRTGNSFVSRSMSGQMGTFGPEMFHAYVDFRGKDIGSGKGVLVLGLEGVSGWARFDLNSVRMTCLGSAEYSQEWQNRPPLKGFMLPASRPPTEDDFETISSWGASLARFQMVRYPKTPAERDDLLSYDRWLEERMDWLDRALEFGERHNILVVVDMHSTPGDGTGATGNERIFGSGPWASHYLDAWRRIASRFKGRRGIYAYDLVNEPHNPMPKVGDCWALQFKALEIVRAIDPIVPIAIECDWGDIPKPFEWMCPMPMSNVIYQVHMYAPSRFTHQSVRRKEPSVTYPGEIEGVLWNKERLRRELQPVRDFQLRFGARIYVGEFSAVFWAKGADRWLKDVISLFDEYGWDWSYHAFRESSCWSLEHEGQSWSEETPSNDNARKRVVLDGLRK